MKLPYSWLVQLSGLKWPAAKMADRLTLCGTACEDVLPTARTLDKVIVGKVLELHAVEGADKIKRAVVTVGKESFDVICGAPNVAAGQRVPVATIGAKLANGMEIKRAKIRGVESFGMICSESELGLSNDHSGIMVLDINAKVGVPLVKFLDYDDYVMTFELTPNRGDSLSAFGIARDLAALGSVKIKRPKFKVKSSNKKTSAFIKVKIEDTDACPRYAARIIQNVKFAESPWWIKKRLIMCGIRPINNVVDVTNYVMMECGHPLHAFDYDRFGSTEVLVRRAKNGESLTTLDGKTHKLSSEVLLITNGNEAVAAGGVMGGQKSEVENTTTNILLEAAYFKPSVIRRSRKELGMTSESQARFEKGVDPNGVEYAISRAAFLMQEICGGEVLEGIVDAYPRKIKPRNVSLRPERCNSLLGTKLSAPRMKKILIDLEFKVTGGKKLSISVPTFRSDIEREIDLIEEIARIDGYHNIPDAVTNIGPLYTPTNYHEKFKNELRTNLTGLGFDEIISHGLTESSLAIMVEPDLPMVKIQNPVSAELDVMRNSLIPFALNVVRHNLNFRTLDLRLFEIGNSYFPPVGKGDWIEEDRLLLLVTGKTNATWRDKPRELDFYDLTGALSGLGLHFRWPEIEYQETKINCFHEDLSFNIFISGSPVGRIGQLSQIIADKLDIKQKLFLAEMTMSALIEKSIRSREFLPLSIYPAAPRDLAIVVKESVKASEILSIIKNAAAPLAESVHIFDLYQGKQIESGKKSLAVSIIYRSPEGSLSAEQVEQRQQLVISDLKNKLNAEIRDK